MPRTSATLTTEEVSVYEAFCAKHGIIDSHTQDGVANAEFIQNYFLNTWKETMSEKNLETCFPLISSHLKFYAPHQREFEKLHASLNAEEQTSFKEWKGTRGLKDTYQNAVALLSWIKAHGFRVSKENLQLAVGQNRVQPFLEWDESATPPRPEDVRQHKSDGTGFLGKTGVNEPHWKRVQREREERDAANQRSSGASAASVTVREAKQKAESIQGLTHAETDQIGKIFVTAGTEIDWVQTLAARLQMQRQFEKHRAVSRFTR